MSQLTRRKVTKEKRNRVGMLWATLTKEGRAFASFNTFTHGEKITGGQSQRKFNIYVTDREVLTGIYSKRKKENLFLFLSSKFRQKVF